ncbi:hypothetical protein GGS21DRAFT_328170 [Xylaria nigripes]|nr:hypothetical protein GGS21DRAFT_328170 [Xylaria nigripes]
MANLPSQHPTLTLHLTDRALAPLITSARTPQHKHLLTALSNTALNAHESAQRLGLGIPQRIMVEHNDGPLLIQTFLSPPAPRPAQPATNPATTAAAASQPAMLTVPGASANNPPPHHQGALVPSPDNRTGPAGSLAPIPTTYPRGGATTVEEHDPPFSPIDADICLASDDEDDDDDEDEENPDAPPMLLGIVVASAPHETREARRAAVRLERVGREIQGRWTELLQTEGPAAAVYRGTGEPLRRSAAD